jgi:hypothetical protein
MNFLRSIPIRFWIQILGSLVSGGIFVWLLAGQDWSLALNNLRNLPLWLVLASLGFFFIGLLANAWRWQVLLHARGIRVAFGTLVKVVVSGAYASNFLPSTIGGDSFRIVSGKGFSENSAAVVSSVVVDRLIGFLSWVLFLPLPAIVFDLPMLIGRSLTESSGVAAVFGTFGKGFLSRLNQFRIDGISLASGEFDEWRRHPGPIFWAMIISWISLLAVFVGVWSLARGIGIDVHFHEVIAVSSIAYLLTLLPISVNGYGIREITVTTLYVQLGSTLEQAASLALLTRILSLIRTLPGLYWLPKVLTTGVTGDSCPRSNNGA